MQVTLKDSDVQTIRRLNAVINGKLGGMSTSPKKSKSSARNIRKATKARIASAA